MLTSIDEFNQMASAIEPIRLVEASSTLHLAVGYLPIPIVRRFMPLSFASSQNSLLSTTRALNYDAIILLSSYLTDFSDFFWRQQRYLNTAPHDPYYHLTPPYLHVVDDKYAPQELERVGSIVTCCVNHSNRFLFDTYAVSHSCLQEFFPLQKSTAHPRPPTPRWTGSSDSGLPPTRRLSKSESLRILHQWSWP